MRSVIIIIGMVYTLCALSPVFGQTPDKYVQVGDTTINLADVEYYVEPGDISKNVGYVFEHKKQLIVNTYNDSSIVETEKTLFISPGKEYYAIVIDSMQYGIRTFGAGYNTHLYYYDKNGTELFNKRIVDGNTGRLYISLTGHVILIDVGSENLEELYVYTKNGELLRTYNRSFARIFSSRQHKYFFIKTNIDDMPPKTCDLIHSDGTIDEVAFPAGYLGFIKFSPAENFYVVQSNKGQLLYDINHHLIWKLENQSGIIICSDEKSYMTNNYQNNSIELRDLFNHQLIYSIDHVTYGNVQLPIYGWDVIDSNFYTIGRNDSAYIYNFYNVDGAIMQTEMVPVIKRTKPYKVIRGEEKFIIKPR
ncbi:MAG: hypothetical protein KQH67_02285 [Bacteroidetes bacterium]|nr:hypothetical protein [Bacteroidota bacterium]